VDRQLAADCAFFRYDDLGPLPPEIVAQLDEAERAKTAGEPLSPTQHALIYWMNRDAKKITMRRNYCGPHV
jgi:hypothetical protein